jgi:hypothetical protein
VAKPVRVAKKLLLVLLLGFALSEVVSTAVLRLRPDVLRGLALGPAERRERLAEGIRHALARHDDMIAVHDPDLGWRPRAGIRNGPDDVDSRSLRSKREYDAMPPDGVLRIAAFGDSFVYGSEVSTDECWPTVLERIRPDTEVLNYGVPGYGQDQVYLRFLAEAKATNPRIVLFGVAPPTLDRMVSVMGAFRMMEGTDSGAISKPRFELDEHGDLALIPNPLKRLEDLHVYLDDPRALQNVGRHDFWYEPLLYESWWFDHSHACRLLFAGWAIAKRRYLDPDRPICGPPGRGVFNSSSSAFRILATILVRFSETARRWGMQPLVLLLPEGYSVERRSRGRVDTMDPLRKLCVSERIPFADASEAFLGSAPRSNLDALFLNEFHYSPEGHRIVARWLRGVIDARPR